MFMDGTELLEEFKKERVKLNREVVVEDGYVGFPKYNYWIELKRIDTHAKAINMVVHLLEKEWVTKNMLLEMLRKVHRATGLRLHG